MPQARTGNATESILIVDADSLFRLGLSVFLGEQADLDVVGETDAHAAVLSILEEEAPDLLILGVEIENGGLELIKDVRTRSPRLPVLVLSHHDEMLYAPRALRAGARGFLSKNEPPRVVLHGVRTVLTGSFAVSDRVLAILLDGNHTNGSDDRFDFLSRLTDRELQTFHLLGDGWGTRQIAEGLHLSVKTVENYREHIKEKLRLGSGTELVRWAIQWRLEEQRRVADGQQAGFLRA